MPFGYAAAAVGTIGAAEIGSQATSKAASQQTAQEQQALDLQKGIYNQAQANVQPYVSSGQNALLTLNQLLGLQPGGNPVTANPILQMLGIGGPGPTGSINPSTFTGSPGYQYALQQGQNAITNQATTGPGGGNALMALQKNAEGLANQNWGNYLSNASTAWQQLLSSIGGQAGQGLTAAGTLTGANQSNINAQSGILGNIGNSQSAGTIGSANALAGGLNNLFGTAGSAGLSGAGNGLISLVNNSIYGPGGGGMFSSAPGSIPGGGTGMVPGGEGGGAIWGNGP